ncbi:hypothetical protein ACGF4C_19770 [Streptomyces sp. NPDC048197]|uniref:hypothetical protein n=1 Tax=Streptomyces sp. NPDC048197 TaxID=3365511 RepID=UPI0037165CAE
MSARRCTSLATEANPEPLSLPSPRPLAEQDVEITADSGYQGAGTTVHIPIDATGARAATAGRS